MKKIILGLTMIMFTFVVIFLSSSSNPVIAQANPCPRGETPRLDYRGDPVIDRETGRPVCEPE
jgi:hypothetical protein